MKTCREAEIYHAFLISALDGGLWSVSCPGCFTPREIVPVPNEWAKVKVKLSVCLTKNHIIETYRGKYGTAPCILNLDTVWILVCHAPATLPPL
jgi:hypothetical protein